MVLPSLQESVVARDRSVVREYGSLFLLVLASVFLRQLLTAGVDAVAERMPAVLDPRLVGAVVYATLAVAALAALYVAYRRLRPSADGLARHDLLSLAGTTTMVLLVAAYVLHGSVDLPVFPGDVVTSFLNGVVAMGLLAVVYARARGFDLRIEAPDRSALPLAGAATLVSALVGAAWLVAYAVVREPRFGVVIGGPFAPQLSAGALAWSVVVPSVLVGVGMGVLYNGAIQESLREHVGPAGAVAAVTALSSVASWAVVDVGLADDAVATAATTLAVVALSLLAASLAARGTRELPRSLGVEPTPAVAAAFGGCVVALLLLAVSGLYLSTWQFVPAGVSIAAVAAAASVGYERARSAWVPAIAFSTFLTIVDADLALYLARVLG